MKVVLLLLCAFVAVQGYSVHPVAKAPTKDLDDVIQAIRAIIERIREIIAEISANLPEIIQSIRDRIKEIIAQLPEIVQAIRDRIQEIINESAAARACVQAQREPIEQLLRQAAAGVQGCIQAAEGQADVLREQLEALITTAQSVGQDIGSRVLSCISDNQANPAGIVSCLQDQLVEIRQELQELEVQVRAVLEAAREVAETAGRDLVQCVAAVREDIAPQEQAIVNEIRECIQNSE